MSDSNGGLPVSIWNRSTPNEYTSLPGVAASPDACSGEIVVAVPITAPVSVSVPRSLQRATPKSAIFAVSAREQSVLHQ
ncbi:MAG TPA: hypothetical protein VGJ25_05170 [Gaiellaceae bacterium]